MTDSGPRRIVGSLRSALALIQRRARGRPRTATATANEEVPVPTLAELRHLLSEHDARTEQRVGHIIDGAPGEWLTAFETIREEDRRESQFVCLLTTEATVRALRRESWDFDFGDGAPGFAVGYGHGEQGVEYRTVNADGIIPLVYYRTFNGIFPHTVELAEDFRLFWGLYLNSAAGQWSMVDDSGDTVVVAEQTATALRIRREFVRRYQAARQLALDLQFNIIRHGGNELRSLADLDVEVDEGNCRISYSGGSEILNNDRYFTRCLGKRILAPPAIEHSGVWPFEPARRFTDFIIGIDDDGRNIEHTCDPDSLSNFFGANAGAPLYLTPVFFRRAVLDKYYADPNRYQVEDGYLRAGGLWGLPIDNALAEHVAVFLGDLGRLQEREQQYWRSFNVAPAGGLSETAIRRSFLNQFADTDRIEYRFYEAYELLNEAWPSRFGWPIFKELHSGDAHLTHSLHVPTSLGFAAFDAQLTGLAKLVVDSLNEEMLGKNLTGKVADQKGIGKLERFLDEQGLDTQGAFLCETLRRVQGARSRSSAHRKGSDFNEATLLDGAPDLPTAFHNLLSSLRDALDQLSSELT